MGRALSIQNTGGAHSLPCHKGHRPLSSARNQPNPKLPNPTTVTRITTAPKIHPYQRCLSSCCWKSSNSSSSSSWCCWQFLCVPTPRAGLGGGRGPPAERAGLGAGPQTLACSAAAAIVVHKMATGPCALPLTLYMYLMPIPLKHRPTKCSKKTLPPPMFSMTETNAI